LQGAGEVGGDAEADAVAISGTTGGLQAEQIAPPAPPPPPAQPEVVAPPTPVPATRSATLRIRTVHAELLGDPLRRVLAFLERTSWDDSPKVAAGSPDLNALRVETREVLAYRRLHSPESAHLELEQFVLEAAALRVRVTAQAEELVALRVGLQTGSDAQGAAAAGRVLCHLAAQFERRFDLYLQEAVQSGDVPEARALLHLRMRLLREYSGLWLLVHG
jgi:hypothetical protein